MFFKACFFFLLSLSLNAAEFVIEPGAGVVVGEFEQSFSNIQSSTYSSPKMDLYGDMYGVELFAKLYWKNILDTPLFFGVDSSSSFLAIEVMNPQLMLSGYDPDLSASRIQAGPLLGLDFGIGWVPRIWATYHLVDAFMLSDGDQSDTYIGSGYKFGLSFGTTWRFNIEYKISEYDTRDGEDLPVRHTVDGVSLTEEKLETSEVLISLSFPISI